MIAISYIIALFAVIISLLLLAVSLLGVLSIRTYLSKAKLTPTGESELLDPYNDIGISVIVSGFRKLEHVQQLLSLNHIRYEVVLLVDLQTDEHAHELLEYYSMVAIDKSLSLELPCTSIRAVYRSRERRYRKLMVVDRRRTTISQEYNCGVNLCSYEYVVSIDGWCSIDRDALQRVITELFEQCDSRRVYAIGGFRAEVLPHGAMHTIDNIMRMVVLGAGMSALSRLGVAAGLTRTPTLGRYTGTMIVFDREIAIEAGGYRSDFFPDSELYSRLRRTMRSRNIDTCALFIPHVLSFEHGPKALPPNTLPLSGASFIERVVSRRVSTLFFAVCAVVLGAGVLSGGSSRIILLTLCMTYVVTLCVTSFSLVVADKLLLRHFGSKTALQLIPVMFLYPFFLLYCLLSPKKFY